MSVVAVPSRRSWLKFAVAAVLILNIVDACLTIIWTNAGIATEANPLMDDVLARSPLQFMICKLTLVSLGMLLLWRMRRHRFAAGAILGSVVVYTSLALHHLQGMPQLYALVH